MQIKDPQITPPSQTILAQNKLARVNGPPRFWQQEEEKSA